MVLDTGAPITSLSRAASDQPAGLGLLRFTSQPNFYFLTQTAIEGRPVGVAARLDRLQIVGLLGLDFLSLFEDIHFNLPSMTLRLVPPVL